MDKEIRILPELETLLEPLSEVALKGLEESLLLTKDSDPPSPELWLWGDILVDGHNRYKMCLKHGLKFRTKQMWPEVKDLDEIKARIMLHAVGQRNMSPQKVAECRTGLYERKIASGKSIMEAMAETAAETNVSPRQIRRDKDRVENTNKLAPEIKSSKAASELSSADVAYLANKTTPQQQKDIFDRAGWDADKVKEEIARSKRTVKEPFPTRSSKERKLATTPTSADVRRAKMPPLAGMISQMQSSLAELNKTLNGFRKAGGGDDRTITRMVQNMDQIDAQLAQWKTDTEFDGF